MDFKPVTEEEAAYLTQLQRELRYADGKSKEKGKEKDNTREEGASSVMESASNVSPPFTLSPFTSTDSVNGEGDSIAADSKESKNKEKHKEKQMKQKDIAILSPRLHETIILPPDKLPTAKTEVCVARIVICLY